MDAADVGEGARGIEGVVERPAGRQRRLQCRDDLGGETLEQFLDAYAQRLMDHLGLPGGDPALRWDGGRR